MDSGRNPGCEWEGLEDIPTVSKKRVTMLLFHHPPLGGSASYRNSLMSLHLSSRGWTPRIITVMTWVSYFRDPTIKHGSGMIRTPAPDPASYLGLLGRFGLSRLAGIISRWISFPDRSLPWSLLAIPEALKASRNSDVIFSTSPPESTHLLAWILKKLTGKPWVADFSNEWSDNPSREDSPRRLRLHRRLERFLLKSADRITTLSPFHTALLKRTYPRPERIETLWTGWDPEEAGPAGLLPPKENAKIMFTGMFYGIQRPDPFLDAVDHGKIPGIEFHILGDVWDSSDRLRKASIPVKVLGRFPRGGVLQRMREADFLLITLTRHAPGVVPGKMFEYAGAGRPILAVVPPNGEVAKWVEETKTGFVIPCEPRETAAKELRTLLDRWRKGTLEFSPDPEALRRYSAPRIADDVDRILERTVRDAKQGSG